MEKFVVFEGIDGCGKSTALEALYDFLWNETTDSIRVGTEPTSYESGELIRKALGGSIEGISSDILLGMFLADRAIHQKEISIANVRRSWYLCDRYIYTSIANMKARNYRNESWFYEALKEIIKPNISFLAFVEPEIAISRIKAREEEKDRYLDESLLYRVTNEFLLLALQEDLKVIDSSTSSDITFEYIKKELDKYV